MFEFIWQILTHLKLNTVGGFYKFFEIIKSEMVTSLKGYKGSKAFKREHQVKTDYTSR